MATKLSGITITHISLVKAGANNKSIIYKSCDKEPIYKKQIEIKKSDVEEGVVYGIVYSPDEIDTDDEYADAGEIKKAAYSFMKNKNTVNVDKDHSFANEKAFIAQSWITKENDATFPNEKQGSWAVAIQLEDEELKKAAKNGEIAGISMAGVAVSTKEKSADKNESLIETIKKTFETILNKNKESKVNEKEIEDAIKKAVEPLVTQVNKLSDELKGLKVNYNETKETLKKSRQNNTPEEKVEEYSTGGIL